ncbi:ABC transporter ATP-binding protein [Desulfurococcaceae archaeon MEX13E-LK6-19]|nr:ABC transporter ATP-binding protein [Desulfurococcaceae archaeon MEX13E-LK6-19]
MPGGKEVIIDVKNLSVHYMTLRGFLKAVNDVDLTIYKGEIMGIVGESGSGKSTLAMAIMNILPPTARIVSGSIFFDGKDLVRLKKGELREILWKRISIIPQAALNALNPVLKIKSHFLETARAHGIKDREWVIDRASKLLELLRLDPERVLESYPHELSGGMKQRVLIALAMLLEPEVLILDEPTTALDVLTQRFILDLLKELHEKTRITMIFITHDIAVIADLADRVAIMYAGKIVEVGDVFTVFKNPYHPYTLALMKSIPSLIGDINEMKSIPGTLPDLINPPPGCLFAPRCSKAMDICRKTPPPYIEIKKDHFVACWLYSKKEG